MKKKRRFRRHCSDTNLLGYSDGELSWLARFQVKRHLRSCWECRRALDELEQQAQRLGRVLENSSYPEASRAAEANRRFLAWVAECEREQQESRAKFNWNPIPSRAGLAGALCLLLVATGLVTWDHLERRPPEPLNVLRHTQQFEQTLLDEDLPFHHTLRVEIIEIKPKTESRSGELEIWSWSNRYRMASRWRDARGSLKHAVWTPSRNRSYDYDPALSLAVQREADVKVESASLIELSRSGVDLESFERSFMEWIKRQHWHHVSFASEFVSFSNEAGVVLHAEPVRSYGGDAAIRLTARRSQRDLTIELVMEVNAQNYKPQFQKIRFETSSRTVELRLLSLHEEFVNPERLVATVFEPDFPIASMARASKTGYSQTGPQMENPVLDQLITSNPSELLSAAIQAEYVLHRHKACLGEGFEVIQTPRRSIVVRGVARSAERRAELVSALSQVSGLDLQIESSTDALKRLAKISNSPDFEGQENRPDLDESLAVTEVQSGRLPIQAELERYFKDQNERTELGQKSGSVNPHRIQQQILQLSNEALAHSQSTLAEAWKLRRLAAQFGPDKTRGLSASTRLLLETMIRDHMSGMQAHLMEFRGLVQPVLISLSDPQGTLPSASEGSSRINLPSLAGWPDACLNLFSVCDQVKRLTFGLFAGIEPQQDFDEQAISKLMALFPRLDNVFQAMGDEISREFAARNYR